MTHELFTTENAWSVIDTAALDCHSHSEFKVTFNIQDIAKVFYYNQGCNCGDELDGGMCNTYCDTWSHAIFSIKRWSICFSQKNQVIHLDMVAGAVDRLKRSIPNQTLLIADSIILTVKKWSNI